MRLRRDAKEIREKRKRVKVTTNKAKEKEIKRITIQQNNAIWNFFCFIHTATFKLNLEGVKIRNHKMHYINKESYLSLYWIEPTS